MITVLGFGSSARRSVASMPFHRSMPVEISPLTTCWNVEIPPASIDFRLASCLWEKGKVCQWGRH